MKKIFLIVLSFSLLSCKKETVKQYKNEPIPFTSVSVDTILTDSISIRAIAIDSGKIWYAADNGKYGYQDLISKKAFTGHVIKDTLPEFRSIAKTTENIFIASIGNPGLVYRISKDGAKINLVYHENNEKVFYDSMQFWNDNEGIAIGDPIDNCLSVIITRNGGATWEKLSCNQLPEVAKGEAAFAASNTNLVVKGNNTWMVSGGKKSRIFFSSDKGNSWKVYTTPIVQGKTMTGIFTVDFYDEKTDLLPAATMRCKTKIPEIKLLPTMVAKPGN
jgi:photosystem II stability/assembly factor-like uncharacterized protein